MTTEQARAMISMHAGTTENFFDGYCYALRYGFPDLQSIQQRFDEMMFCLQTLYKTAYPIHTDRALLSELQEMVYSSILYCNRQCSDARIVGVFAEVLSETLLCILEDTENPFAAFAHYKENYDDILLPQKTTGI